MPSIMYVYMRPTTLYSITKQYQIYIKVVKFVVNDYFGVCCDVSRKAPNIECFEWNNGLFVCKEKVEYNACAVSNEEVLNNSRMSYLFLSLWNDQKLYSIWNELKNEYHQMH